MTKKRQLDFDIVYMGMAKCVSELSYAQRNKVGCVIVSPDGQVISQGYNGTPSGMDNCCEDVHCSSEYIHGCIFTEKPIEQQLNIDFCTKLKDSKQPCRCVKLTTKPEVLHAESNAITKCAKYGGSTNNSTIYVTLSPCYECSKLIIQAGIKRVVYDEVYRVTDGLDLLIHAGIDCEQLDINNRKIIPYKINK